MGVLTFPRVRVSSCSSLCFQHTHVHTQIGLFPDILQIFANSLLPDSCVPGWDSQKPLWEARTSKADSWPAIAACLLELGRALRFDKEQMEQDRTL